MLLRSETLAGISGGKISLVFRRWDRARVKKGTFSVLSGDDNITLPLMSVGGRGVISVIANIVPRETAEMTHAALAGDWKQARELHLKLFPLSRAMFLETNPIPVKEAMAMMGLLEEPEFRLPMCRLAEVHRPRLKAVLASLGLLKG